jgi:hypothetical protein
LTYLVTLFWIWSWHLFSFDDFNEETKVGDWQKQIGSMRQQTMEKSHSSSADYWLVSAHRGHPRLLDQLPVRAAEGALRPLYSDDVENPLLLPQREPFPQPNSLPKLRISPPLQTTVIWIPTLFTFAFAFQLIMRDSGAQPWDDEEHKGNGTSALFMALFQSFTKTSAMVGQ